MSEPKSDLRWTVLHSRTLYGFAALSIFAVSWRSRANINPDGISYLDLSREMLKANASAYFHPYWSPLLPALIAMVQKIASPKPNSILLLAHAVITASALAGLVAFIHLVDEWRRLLATRGRKELTRGQDFSLSLFGLVLLLSAVTGFLGTDNISPDMLVLALVFAIAGTSCRLANGRGRAGSAFWLGLFLALGYFTKAALFPLALLFLMASAISWLKNRTLVKHLLIASLVFTALAAPYIAILSVREHKVTFGESGRLSYAWLVLHNSPSFAGWTQGSQDSGYPAHPLRVSGTNPTILQFDNTVQGTLPIWYNPVYFYDGLKAPFDLKLQIKQVLRSPSQVLKNTTKITAVALAVPALLFVLGRRRGQRSRFAAPWLIAWAFGAYFMYSLIELLPRFVGSFFVIIVFVGASEFLTRIPEVSIRLGNLTLFIGALLLTGLVASRSARRFVSPESNGTLQQLTADDLQRLGVLPRGRLAVVGDPFNVYFAFRDNLRVVATIGFRGGDIPADTDKFWSMDNKSQTALEDRLANVGVTAIISSSSCTASGSGWVPIGNNEYCALLIGGGQRKSQAARP